MTKDTSLLPKGQMINSFFGNHEKAIITSEPLITIAYQLEIGNMVSNTPNTMTTTITAAPTAISSFLSTIESHSFTLLCYTSHSII